MIKNTHLAALIATSIGLSGCMVEGKAPQPTEAPVATPEPINTTNLSLTSLAVDDTHVYQPNDSLQVNYRLHIEDLDNQNVAVDFYLVHDEPEADSEEDTDESEVEGDHLLGVMVHQSLSTGEYDYHLEFEVPGDLAHDGNYWIMAIVDPENEIEESNEEDNHPHPDNDDHVAGDFPFAEIQVELHPEHEFKLSNITIDGDVVILDTPTEHDGTGEHHSDVIGHLDAIYHGSETAQARFDAEVLIDGAYQAVKLWDAEQHAYQDNIDIEFTYNGEDHYFGFDIEFSDAQRNALHAAGAEEISLRYNLTDITESEKTEHDTENSVEVTYPLFFFEQEAPTEVAERGEVSAAGITSNSNELSISGSYAKTYGDKKKVGVGLDLSSLLKLDLRKAGAIAEAGSSFDVYVFNKKATMFRIGFDAAAYAQLVGSGYSAEMVLFGAKIIDESYERESFVKTWEKDWEEQRQIVKSTFFVGPIPMSVEAGVNGAVGFDFTLEFDGKLKAYGDLLSSNFDVYANGGVEAGIASAGITASFTIFEDLLRLDSEANLVLLQDGNVNPAINYKFKLSNELDVIKGNFGLHAQTRSVKWCKKKKWGIKIKYPCGIKTKDYYYWFYRTNSIFNKSWTIFEKNGSFL